MTASATRNKAVPFHGWKVAWAAFVLAVLGWGMGFYGPPVFLKILHEQRGWPFTLISGAVTIHFLVGALSGANMPALHRRFGTAAVTRACAAVMAVGLIILSSAQEVWQLFCAALLTGASWGGMGAPALNIIVSPWFVRKRPIALGMAYNGASIGGMIFSPLWVAAIAALGFANATIAIAAVMFAVLWLIAGRYFSLTPEQMALRPDGDEHDGSPAVVSSPHAKPLPGRLLLKDWNFVTLAAAATFGLFAQIGLVAHLYSLLAPALGAQSAGFAMALITGMAIAGRTLLGLAMPIGADRRLVASTGYFAQVAGSLMFYLAAGQSVSLLIAGVILFGLGFGNASSLPPLIAQVEFTEEDVTRAVALVVGMSQGIYAFAPATFGVIRTFGPEFLQASPGYAPGVFLMTGLCQSLAIVALLAGRHVEPAAHRQ